MNKSIVFFLTCIFSIAVFAQQKFKTHAVKDGETIESIAKTYKVTPFDILKLNPEAKNGVKKNTILIIPTAASPAATVTSSTAASQEQEIRFIKHKVRRKETLYSIAKYYNVSEEAIKRYNRELYGRQLRKGEKIDIPKYINRSSVSSANTGEIPEGMTKYVVKAREGKWRVAYEHGISVDELQRLNPDMKEILQEGDALIVPQLEANAVRKVDASNYNYYTVLPKEGFYRLKVKLGVTQEEIEKLNPEVAEDGLKVGMILRLPKGKMGDYSVNEGKLVAKFSLLDSIHINTVSNIAFVIPFKLNEFDFDSISNVKRKLAKDRLVSVSVDFYTGALMALDSAKQLGLSVNVKVFDSEGSESAVSRLLSNNNFNDCHAVVGPILAKPFNRLASGLRDTNVPVFAPLSSKDISLYNNVFQTLPSDEMITDKMIAFISKGAINKNVIIIADKKNTAAKAKLLSSVPSAKVITPQNDAFVKMEDLNAVLSSTTENWVVVESNSIPLLTNVTNLLNSMRSNEKKIMMLTTKKGDAYDTSDDIKNAYLSSLNFHFPTVDRPSDSKNSFHKGYEKRFGASPNRYAIRGFDLTMDIILRLAYEKDLYKAAGTVSETEYVENKFDYQRGSYGGFYNKGIYIVMFDKMEIKEVQNDL